LTLSHIAKENSLYLVANMLIREKCESSEQDCNEEDGFFKLFNANVAFDREGKVTAVYRKQHLYGDEKKWISARAANTPVFFDADFGARIGLMTCFDLLAQEPADKLVRVAEVDAVALPVAWVDEVPFLTALQAHPGWSAAHDVALLAAGKYAPTAGALGSGLYGGRGGVANFTNFVDGNRRKLLVADVPYRFAKEKQHEEKDSWKPIDPWNQDKMNAALDGRFILAQDLKGYEWKPMRGTGSVQVLGGNCKLDFSLEEDESSDEGSYALVGFRGARSFGGGQHWLGVHNCGLIYCKDKEPKELSSCGQIPSANMAKGPKITSLKLTLTHSREEKPMPLSATMALQPLRPLEITYTSSKGVSTLTLNVETRSLYSFGLLSRVFSLDEK